MGRADVDFDVLSWHGEHYVEEVHVYGVLADGTPIDYKHTFGEAENVDVIGVRRMIAKINNGRYRI